MARPTGSGASFFRPFGARGPGDGVTPGQRHPLTRVPCPGLCCFAPLGLGSGGDSFVEIRDLSEISLQMTLKIHALMKNSHNINSRIDRAIENHVPTDQALAIALADHIAGTTKNRIIGKGGQAAIDRSQIALGLLCSPSLKRVIPNRFKVGYRRRPKEDLSHAELDFWTQ